MQSLQRMSWKTSLHRECLGRLVYLNSSLRERIDNKCDMQAAHLAARRTVRDDRSRTNQLLAAAQKKLEEREAATSARLEQVEESWKAER